MPKNNRTNTDFQILHFIVGACHTPDGAYSVLCDLKDDREMALKEATITEMRNQAKLLTAKKMQDNIDEVIALEGKIIEAEIQNGLELFNRNIAAARAELAFIEACMGKIEPYRLYSNIPLPLAHEAAQREEWKLELLRRVENSLLTSGTLPSELFNLLRVHPDFETVIAPRILELGDMLAKVDGRDRLASVCSGGSRITTLLVGVKDESL